MKLYDDKTKNAINNGMQLLLPVVDANEDIIFKASYVIAGDLRCSGKVSALFDLIVLGDASAKEIDVKGRFVCMGHCTVNGAIIVAISTSLYPLFRSFFTSKQIASASPSLLNSLIIVKCGLFPGR